MTADSVPLRYRDATLDGYVVTSASQRAARDAAAVMVARLTADPPRPASLALLGSPGVGKSHLAAAVCHAVARHVFEPWEAARTAADAAYAEAMRRWQDGPAPIWNDRPKPPRSSPPVLPQWVNVPSLVVDIKAEMSLGQGQQESTSFARGLRHRDSLVVLDDLGRERISEWTGELLYTIVNDRYEAGLPTIATSNLTVDELVAAGYWPAISRLAQDGRLIAVDGADHRLRKLG